VHHPRGVMVKKGSYPRISPPAFHHWIAHPPFAKPDADFMVTSLSCGWPSNGVSLQKTPTAMEVVGTAMLATRFGLLIETSK
jgi:hypothetical protein